MLKDSLLWFYANVHNVLKKEIYKYENVKHMALKVHYSMQRKI